MNLLNNQYFEITTQTPIENMLNCDVVTVIFKKLNHPLSISTRDVFEITIVLHNILKGCLDNNYHLDPSIDADIGFIWNEYLQEKIKVKYYSNQKGETFWVGSRHLFTTTKPRAPITCASWFYNNDQGDIIFEITPSYRWHFTDPKEGQEFITYDEFIKNYKPLVTTIIPKDIAQDMFEQTKHILRVLEENSLKKPGT